MTVNQYVNKVVYGGNTIIDISDTTAVASDVAQGKYFYTLAGQKVQGTAVDGNDLAYGLTAAATSSRIGVGQIDYMEVE